MSCVVDLNEQEAFIEHVEFELWEELLEVFNRVERVNESSSWKELVSVEEIAR